MVLLVLILILLVEYLLNEVLIAGVAYCRLQFVAMLLLKLVNIALVVAF